MKKHRLLVAVFASLTLTGWSQDSAIIVESFSDGLNSSGFSQVEGKWSDSEAKSTADGVKATRAVFNDANADPATARFTPDLPAAGKYQVFITYPISANASDVIYRVSSADGETTTAITQYGRDLGHVPAANTWFSLGTYNFGAGKEGYVEISDPLTGKRPLDSEPNARIYADAVKFVPADGTVAAAPALPSADTVSSTVVADAAPVVPADPASEMPPLPGAAIPAALPSLPSTPPAATVAGQMPALPASPASAAQLPTLPAAPADAAQMPSLPPAPGAVAQMPALPAAPDPAVEMPSLPAAPTPATDAAGLPSLPASTPGTQAAELPSLPDAGVTPAVPVPPPLPNLPSLATVTPTPERTMPSPSDTPVPGAITSMPGGVLGNLPPMPTPATIAPGLAIPTPIASPVAASAGVTPAAAPAGYSITQYNPSNLPWMYDLGAAMKAARDQNKKVLVFFTAEQNKAAQSYETEMFSDPTIKQELSKYVLVKSDFPRNTRVAYNLGVFGAGVIVVVNTDGVVTSRVVQKPLDPAALITQLAATKAIRETPAPVPQSGADNAAAPATMDPAAANAGTTADLSAAPGGLPMTDPAAMPPAVPTAPDAMAVPGLPALPPPPAPGAMPAPGAPAPGAPAAPAPVESGDPATAMPDLPGL